MIAHVVFALAAMVPSAQVPVESPDRPCYEDEFVLLGRCLPVDDYLDQSDMDRLVVDLREDPTAYPFRSNTRACYEDELAIWDPNGTNARYCIPGDDYFDPSDLDRAYASALSKK